MRGSEKVSFEPTGQRISGCTRLHEQEGGTGMVPWPPHPIALSKGARGAKGSFMAIIDMAFKRKKILQPHTHQKHPVQQRNLNIYNNIITKCDASVPRANSRRKQKAEQ